MKKIRLFLAIIAMLFIPFKAWADGDSISVKYISSVYAYVEVYATGDDYYYTAALPADEYDELEAGASIYFRSVAEYTTDYLLNKAKERGETIQSQLQQGNHGYQFWKFPSDTDCVVYACKANPVTGECQKPFLSQRFHTRAVDNPDTVRVRVKKTGFKDNTAEDGSWTIMGMNLSNGTVFALLFSCLNTESIVGTYTLDDMDFERTYLNDPYRGSNHLNLETFFMEVTDNDGTISISAKGLAENGFFYEITFDEFTIPSTAITEVTSDSKYACRKVMSNGKLIIEYDGKRYDTLGIEQRE